MHQTNSELKKFLILEIVQIIINQSNFKYKDKVYHDSNRLPMGGPISDKRKASLYLTYVNSVHRSVLFELQIEEQQNINFLDLLFKRKT